MKCYPSNFIYNPNLYKGYKNRNNHDTKYKDSQIIQNQYTIINQNKSYKYYRTPNNQYNNSQYPIINQNKFYEYYRTPNNHNNNNNHQSSNPYDHNKSKPTDTGQSTEYIGQNTYKNSREFDKYRQERRPHLPDNNVNLRDPRYNIRYKKYSMERYSYQEKKYLRCLTGVILVITYTD